MTRKKKRRGAPPSAATKSRGGRPKMPPRLVLRTRGVSLCDVEMEALAEEGEAQGYSDVRQWMREKLLRGRKKRVEELRTREGR